MCRWFAYISPTEPCLLSDVLINPANAISKQCSEHYLPRLLPHGKETDLEKARDKLLRLRNSLLNMDGLGVAWYSHAAERYEKAIVGSRPAMYKTQSPPSNDFNFRNICCNIESNCVFAHIRATSGSVVQQTNSHPFMFGRHLFMHNGVISDFPIIRRAMMDNMSYDAYTNVLGTTDSEHAAALYITQLTGGGSEETWQKEYCLVDMTKAMVNTIRQIMDLQRQLLGSKARPNSLNFCATDGIKMVAVRFRNHHIEQPPSLYWSQTAGRRLNRKYPGNPNAAHEENESTVHAGQSEHGNHVIVSSEPTTYDEKGWNLITRNCAMIVDKNGHVTEVPIKYEPELNAEEPDEAHTTA